MCVCVCIYIYIYNLFIYLFIYLFVIVKYMGHYDYSSERFDYGICNYNAKNTTNGLCDESVCITIMVVINVFYDYKCSHICNYIFHILL
jgi:hypothetical protein